MRISDWSSDVCSSDLSAPPGLVMDLIRSILGEKDRYRSVDAVIYITNHYVETAESPLASLLWAPAYKGYPSDKLVEFIDRSEEHTSELQSLMRISYAVFCLKKKTKKTSQHRHTKNIEK